MQNVGSYNSGQNKSNLCRAACEKLLGQDSLLLLQESSLPELYEVSAQSKPSFITPGTTLIYKLKRNG